MQCVGHIYKAVLFVVLASAGAVYASDESFIANSLLGAFSLIDVPTPQYELFHTAYATQSGRDGPLTLGANVTELAASARAILYDLRQQLDAEQLQIAANETGVYAYQNGTLAFALTTAVPVLRPTVNGGGQAGREAASLGQAVQAAGISVQCGAVYGLMSYLFPRASMIRFGWQQPRDWGWIARGFILLGAQFDLSYGASKYGGCRSILTEAIDYVRSYISR